MRCKIVTDFALKYVKHILCNLYYTHPQSYFLRKSRHLSNHCKRYVHIPLCVQSIPCERGHSGFQSEAAMYLAPRSPPPTDHLTRQTPRCHKYSVKSINSGDLTVTPEPQVEYVAIFRHVVGEASSRSYICHVKMRGDVDFTLSAGGQCGRLGC